jgi:hypothetical protein
MIQERPAAAANADTQGPPLAWRETHGMILRTCDGAAAPDPGLTGGKIKNRRSLLGRG